MRNKIVLTSLLFFSICCYADKKLAPVMGADGRMIIMEIPSEAADKKTLADKSKPVEKANDANKAPAKISEYNSDEYTNSEDLEAATHPVKKPIAMVRDPLGLYVNLQTTDQSTHEDPSPMVVIKSKDIAKTMTNNVESFNAEQRDKVLAGEECISLKKYKPVMISTKDWQMLMMDKKTEIFVKPSMPIDIFEFPQTKLQEVVIRSYAKRSKSPEFFSPVFAFLSEKGCFLRAVGSVFDRYYAPNDWRFAMIEGFLPVYANEKFLAVIFPEQINVHSDYSVSRYGQLGIRVKP